MQRSSLCIACLALVASPALFAQPFPSDRNFNSATAREEQLRGYEQDRERAKMSADFLVWAEAKAFVSENCQTVQEVWSVFSGIVTIRTRTGLSRTTIPPKGASVWKELRKCGADLKQILSVDE